MALYLFSSQYHRREENKPEEKPANLDEEEPIIQSGSNHTYYDLIDVL